MCAYFFDYFEIMSIIKIRYIEEYCVFDICKAGILMDIQNQVSSISSRKQFQNYYHKENEKKES